MYEAGRRIRRKERQTNRMDRERKRKRKRATLTA